MYIVIGQSGFPNVIKNVVGKEQINLAPSACPHIHETLEEANHAAQKLTAKHNRPFYIFCAVGFFKPGVPMPPPAPQWQSML